MQIVSTLERICELQLLTTPLWSWQELTLNTQVRNSNAAIFTNGKLCNFILGNYTCEVEWSPEKAPLSLSHYLEVCVPPSVVAVKTEGGGFVDVKEGDNATLECEADGIPRPLIHWVSSSIGDPTGMSIYATIAQCLKMRTIFQPFLLGNFRMTATIKTIL